MSAQGIPCPSADNLDKVLAKINEIARKSDSGDYIYRGERECYDKVCSSLYHYCKEIEVENFDVEIIQKEILQEAMKYTHQTDEFETLTELQHYGGKTNLIDFTTDYLIALFFACDGDIGKDGRVILLKRSDDTNKLIKQPQNPTNRVIAQKSVFIQPKEGFIKPDDEIKIPKGLKQPILDHLQKCHGISTETIYNDLHGFIKHQTIHQKTIAYYNRGVTYGKKGKYDQAIQNFSEAIKLKPDFVDAYYNRGNAYLKKGDLDQGIQDLNRVIELKPDDAAAYYTRGLAYGQKSWHDHAIQDFNKTIKLKPDFVEAYYTRGIAYVQKGWHYHAIQDFNETIKLKPDFTIAYYSRGIAWLHLGKWDKAKSDLTTAKNMGADVISVFHHLYKSIADFEQKNGVKLPEDLAAMLTPQ